ncbi:zinc ribbon domain-containing protein [bacterium]|nr:zinc ribbon domain-containing protein [bacterium]
MPLYEYKCGKCSQVAELLRERSQRDAPAACPSCGSEKMRRMMSTFAGHVSSGGGSTSSVAGGGGCGGCSRSSCAGCHH